MNSRCIRKNSKNKQAWSIEIEKSFLENHTDFDEIEKYLRPPYRTDIFIVLHSGIVYPLMSFIAKKKFRIPQDIALISIEEGIALISFLHRLHAWENLFTAISTKAANMVWSEVKARAKASSNVR